MRQPTAVAVPVAVAVAVLAQHGRKQGEEEDKEAEEEQEEEEKEAEVEQEGEGRENHEADHDEEGDDDQQLGSHSDAHLGKKHRKRKRKHHHTHRRKRHHKHKKPAAVAPADGEEVLEEGDQGEDATPSLPVDYVVGKCIACGKRWGSGATASDFRSHLRQNKSCLSARDMALHEPLPAQWTTLAMSMEDALEEEDEAAKAKEASGDAAPKATLHACACGQQLSSTATAKALQQHEGSKAHLKYLKSLQALKDLPSPGAHGGQRVLDSWCAEQRSPSGSPAHLPVHEAVEGQDSRSESPQREPSPELDALASEPRAEASRAPYHPCPAVLPLSCTSREQFVQNYPIYVHTLQPPRQWHVAARLDGVHANSCTGAAVMSDTEPQPCTRCASIRNPQHALAVAVRRTYEVGCTPHPQSGFKQMELMGLAQNTKANASLHARVRGMEQRRRNNEARLHTCLQKANATDRVLGVLASGCINRAWHVLI